MTDTGGLTAGAFIFAAGAGAMLVWLWTLAGSAKREAGHAPLIAAAIVPPLLILGLVFGAAREERFGDLRLTLNGVSFTDEALGERAATIGGGAESDDLIVPSLPPGFFSLRLAEAGGAEAAVTATEGPPALARLGDVYLNAIRIEDGVRFCLADCGSASAAWWSLRGDRVVSMAGETAARPLRGAGDAVFDAAHFLTEPQPTLAGRVHLMKREDRWWVMAGAGAEVRGAEGQMLAAPASRALSSTPQSLALYSIAPGEAGVGRTVERRSFRVWRNDDGLVRLTLDTPYRARPFRRADVEHAAGELIDQAADGGGQPYALTLLLRPGAAEGAPAAPGSSVSAAPVLGAPFAESLVARIELAQAEHAYDVSDPRFTLILGESRLRQPFGKPFTDGVGRQAEVVLDRFTAPWLWAAVGLCGWAAGLIATWRLRRENPGFALVAGLADYLLAVRFLMAVGIVAADPARAAEPTIGLAALAMAVGPFVIALPMPGWADRRRVVWAQLGVMALIGLVLWRRAPSGDPSLLIALVIVGACLAAAVAREVLLTGREALWRWAQRLAEDLDRRTRELQASEPDWPMPGWTVLALLGFLAVRLLLVPAGDSIPVGGVRVALSILFTPWSVLILAGLFARGLARGDDPEWHRGAALVFAAVIAVMGGLTVWSGDNGYLIHLLPVIGMGAVVGLMAVPGARRAGALRAWLPVAAGIGAALGVFGLVQDNSFAVGAGVATVLLAGGLMLRWPHRTAWATPAIAILLLGAVGVAAHSGQRWLSPNDAGLQAAIEDGGGARTLAFLQAEADRERNTVRLDAFFNPARLEESGSTLAEEYLSFAAEMRAYNDTFLGRGWLSGPPISPRTELGDVHVDDRLASVHLISPFGRVGALLFLAVLAAAALAAGRLAGPLPRLTAGRATAVLALWVIFGASAYMVLSNLGQAPFTGRNLYLLAATSTSDLAEGLALLGLAAWGLARR